MSAAVVRLTAREASPSAQEEILQTARALAHVVNNRLVLPLGLLELLEQRVVIPDDLRPLFGPAREALEEMAIGALHLEVQTREGSPTPLGSAGSAGGGP